MMLGEVCGGNHHRGGLVLVIAVLTESTVQVLLLLSSLVVVSYWQVATYLRFVLLGSVKQKKGGEGTSPKNANPNSLGLLLLQRLRLLLQTPLRV